MKLSKALAQKIAKEMMKVIPYNINVMDENGVIIGSGDSKRIGTVHEGARIAITSGRINEVYREGGGIFLPIPKRPPASSTPCWINRGGPWGLSKPCRYIYAPLPVGTHLSAHREKSAGYSGSVRAYVRLDLEIGFEAGAGRKRPT